MSDPASRLNEALQGRYIVERQLGEGGMATVYLAQDVRHDRKVALKVLKPELAAVLGGERFLTEIRTTANLQHPRILPLFDSGEDGGFLYYVMPCVAGQSILMRILTENPRSVREVRASVATNVDAALAKALEKLPADRFESAQAVAAALDDAAFAYQARTPSRPTSAVAPGTTAGVAARGRALVGGGN